VNLLAHAVFEVTSLTKVTVAVPLQLSVVVTEPVLTCGMDKAQITVTLAGQVIVGATLSLTVMI
jgi:hypothetical protein